MIETAKNSLRKSFLICFAISLVLTVTGMILPSIHLGFFGYIACLLSMTFFPGMGVFLGDAFRRFVKPDAYFTTDAIDSFRKRVFWMMGPQVIGWMMGLIASNGFMGNILGYPGF